MTSSRTLFGPVLDQNPIMAQVLGVCSALAVTRELEPALVMGAAVTCVLAYTNVAVSLMRGVMPRSIRLILEVTLIASAVIVVDEFLKAYAPDTSRVLTVFVGLIITNCIVLGRAEAFAMQRPVLPSLLDAIGNGLGYALVLATVAAWRELFGAGTLLGRPMLPATDAGGWFEPNRLMEKPVSAFLLIGLLIWLLRGLRPRLREEVAGDAPWRDQEARPS
ncbi:MAG: NADH:ubiquinone reductase (Na(+)-transporting) subunit D [Xanthomonadales bacterium]|nr:NADH:ubiquinone reductase (Na(+)-transporting) subunit D [Xanthomonadales bacterium]NIN60265.1 NADH:ubiquinone reductase (Na(+)-transporting) subunit D [Xanthomonadales bacterium]NIN75617.1 NADH:ubiquinone reductase (Na(+)-transporting) subunit D [Xanthomonadales bacterium]NIO14690.1 NADH:ubiquinone reductase (Na(+)-transporting) subunit D [Xanthomonadales bacterium]NIP12658.1 NADH:ubiquinone reductase (Na(+)-transporting) subunit D [Xanthomonadales bacterium]